MSKHTQAPWVVTHDSEYTAELAIDAVVDGRTVHIALVHGVSSDEETNANAALLAAAPDLLEALQAYVDEARSHTDHGKASSPFAVRLATAEAALAKAK